MVKAIPMAVAVLLAAFSLAQAEALDVPVREHAGDGQAASCGVSEVAGLRADGDGFLAIRSGPGVGYPQIGQLVNGDRVTVFSGRGDWVGIATVASHIDQADVCGNRGPARALSGTGLGWVHGRWLNYLYP